MIYEREGYTQSPVERIFLSDCATVGLIVEPQYPVEKIHADFAIPERKIVIEIDSKMWHSSPVAIKNDKNRDEIYKRNGWNVIRIMASQVYKYGEEIASEIKYGKINCGKLLNYYEPINERYETN